MHLVQNFPAQDLTPGVPMKRISVIRPYANIPLPRIPPMTVFEPSELDGLKITGRPKRRGARGGNDPRQMYGAPIPEYAPEEPGMEWLHTIHDSKIRAPSAGFSAFSSSGSTMTGIVDNWRRGLASDLATPLSQSSLPSFVEPQLGNLALFGDGGDDAYMHTSGLKRFNTRQESRAGYSTTSSKRVKTSEASSSSKAPESFNTGGSLRSAPSTTATVEKGVRKLGMADKPLRAVRGSKATKKRILAPSTSSRSI